MSDDDAGDYNEGGGGSGWLWGLLIFGPILLLFYPVLIGAANSVMFPGYETCKREIGRVLRDPDGADYSWPPRGFSHRSDPNVRGFTIQVRSTNGFGGKVADVFRCTIDESSAKTRYRIEW